VVVYDEEVGSAMTIESIAYQRSDFGDSIATASLEHFEIYMGLSEEDVLDTQFDANYIEDSKYLVYSSDPQAISAGKNEWIQFDLDTPFWYNGTDNLIIEIMWSWGVEGDHLLTWGWDDFGRSLFGYYGSPVGTYEDRVPYMILNGTMVLEPATFGSIKAFFSSL
jgi:hypothetical protein